nr:DbpA RNA binding domain-containing protein [Gemmatimonadaceae bacterium]
LASAADLEAIAAELPKELPRTVATTVETEAVTAYVKAHLKRPRRVGEDVIPDDARPLAAQFVPVTAETRAIALRRVLDTVNAPSTIVAVADDAAEAAATHALQVLGYTDAALARTARGAVGEHSTLRVVWDVPATRAALEDAMGGAPAQVVVLAEPRQVAHLRALLAGGALTQLVLTDIADEATRAATARTAQLRTVLAGGVTVGELRAVESLLAEHDAIAIAAAAIRLLDHEQATVRALRIGVTTVQPKVKAIEATPAIEAEPAPAPRKRAAKAPASDEAPAAAPTSDADVPAASDDEAMHPLAATTPLPRNSRRAEPATTTGVDEWRLVWINVGERDGATPSSLVGAITGESGLDRGVIGAIDLRDTHTLVEIAADQAERVVKAITGSVIRGRDVSARIDQVGGRIERAPRAGGRGGDRGAPRGRPSFGRRDEGGAPPRGGRPFARRDDGDAPRGRPFARRDEGDAPRGRPFRRDEGDAPRGRPFRRDDGGAPRPRPFARRDEGDAPRGRPFARRDEGDAPRGRPFRRDEGDAPRGRPFARRDEAGSDRPRRGFDRRPPGNDFAERAERLQRSRRPAPGARRPLDGGDA